MQQENRKDQIIRVAAKLFKEKGYSAVTMRDLASSLGIKAASLYNHINSKQDILKSIIISIAEEFTEGMNVIQVSNNSSIDKLKQIVKLHVTISSQNIYGMASLNNDWMHLEEADQVHFIKLRDAYEQNFRTIIHQGIKEGSIKNIHPEVVLYSILSTLRTLYLWYEKRGKLEVNILKRDLSATLLHGIV